MGLLSTLIITRAKPLFFYKNELFYSRKNRIFSISSKGLEVTLFEFDQTLIDNLLNSFKLVYRARRSGVWSSAVFEDSLYFSYDRKLYCYDYLKKTLVVETEFEKGRGPLKYSLIEGLTGFDKCLVYGEYFGNTEKKEISVFGKKHKSDWQKIYTFSPGLINHIHDLVPDTYNNCVWILAGDFDDAASIWKATDNFINVESVISGEQIYRSCVAFPTADGLLYATDSQFVENSIRVLKEDGGDFVSEKIATINGPCIYGAEHNDYFAFSTSTEPEMVFNKLSYQSLLTRKPASLIKENQSDLVVVNKNTLKCTLVLSKKKDGWPFALFQFGVLIFPSGSDNTEQLYFYSIGSKSNDLCTESIDLSKIQSE